jgi:hypothetical protein
MQIVEIRITIKNGGKPPPQSRVSIKTQALLVK